MSPTFTSALVLFAHPDDAEFMCAGTVARWVAEGCQVHYVVCTDGSAGSNTPGEGRDRMRPIREAEQRDAAEVLGVQTVTFLGEPDGFLEVTPETRRKVCREVRRLRPEVILAPDPSTLWHENVYINHWDHKQAGLLALTAVMPDAPTRVMFQELEDEGLEPYEIPNLWLSSDDPDTFVDITDTMDLKIQALSRHVSQGVAEHEDWVREWGSELAKRSGEGYEYAEAFKAFRLADED
jgi:LmbE family N-acetylglucosaminyl deacetylase